MEGGFLIDRFLSDNQPFIKETGTLLQLVIMVEAQALDLYLRFAEKMEREDTRNALYQIASEERKHLTAVGRLFDRKLTARS
jgi:rubrerythrin